MGLADLQQHLPALRQLLILLIFTRGNKNEFPHTISDEDMQAFLRSKYHKYKAKLITTQTFLERMDIAINELTSVLAEKGSGPIIRACF